MTETLNSHNLAALFDEQLAAWEQAGANYKALERVLVKDVNVDGFPFKVQFNPARITSSAAKVDAKSISERKCFLCKENRPAVQKGLEYVNNRDEANPYTVLINPFPIFPRHLTIPLLAHTDQLISGRFDAMLNLAKELEGYTLFYNGPKCGASAPDHFHFQAGNRGFLTIERELASLGREDIFTSNRSRVSLVKSIFNGLIDIESSSAVEANTLFEKIFATLEIKEGEREPMVNILCWYDSEIYTTLLYIREKHRPSHYFAEGDANILLSPASVDLGGVMITPFEKDFEKIDQNDIREILNEICISEPKSLAIVNKIKSIL
jgi:ATP adenylyltransferase/5',5'''-P-1,P-4-tetraphosphate phosphorylase II